MEPLYVLNSMEMVTGKLFTYMLILICIRFFDQIIDRSISQDHHSLYGLTLRYKSSQSLLLIDPFHTLHYLKTKQKKYTTKL